VATLLDAPAASHTRSAPAGDVVLETRGLTKRFGSITAVDSLDLTLRRGEVLGFLGPNGSGKSTTISMVLGLVRPTAGDIQIMGQPLENNPSLVSEHIGAIIENPAFYPYLTGRDNLRAQALMVGGVSEQRIDELIKLVSMEGRADGKYKTFSLGMKQRIGIASTLLTNPQLVILDEPTNGLDPAGQREIRSIIPRMADEGHAVLLASHMLHEVEQVSDHALIIRRGKRITEGSVDDLLRRNGYIDVRVPEADPEVVARIVRAVPGVEQASVEENRLVVIADEQISAAINQALAESGLYASQIAPRRSSLEDLFLELTTDEDGVSTV
jgi:ABC-2 type transport system ATP-binding protein